MVTQQKQYTLSEFHAFVELPERKNQLYELIHGEIVEKVASFTPSRIGRFVGNFADAIGYVTGADGSYILSDEDEFMPDVGYISKERLPQMPERQVQGPPDLAVEVKSPTDSKRELRLKAEAYIRFGTRMVWLVFPDDGRVEVYLPGQDVREVDIDGVLDGGDVLPGLTPRC
jgi:Uma2 family endonuclease